MASQIKGKQIQDETITEDDIKDGSIKAAEMSPDAVSGQTQINAGDATNDRLLIWDATDSTLKKIAPSNLGISGGGSSTLLQDADNNTKVMVEKNADENKIRFDTAGTERMIIDETGKVGIGVASPTSPLHVYGNLDGTYIADIDNDQNTNGHVMKLSTDGNGSGSRVLEMENSGGVIFRARADGRFGFGPDGVSSMGAGTFVVGIDNSSHTADIAISQRLQHLGDSNTYMEFPSNDNISFTAGGSEELQIASDAVLVKQYIKHIGDTNTHINFTDDQIVLKAGNISMVKMEEKASAPHEITLNDGGNNIDFVVKGNGSNEGNPGFFFDASNNRVGINGVGSPDCELHVDGDVKVVGEDPRIKIDGDVDSHPGLELYENGSRKWIVYNDYTNDNLNFKSDATRMSIQQGGNVGIGTTSPTETLDVNGTAKATSIKTGLIEYTDGDDAITIEDGGYLKFHKGVQYARSVLVSSSYSPAASGGNPDGGWIKFATFNCPGTSNLDVAASSFMITLAGMESSNNRRLDGIFMVHAKFTVSTGGNADGGSNYYEGEGTRISCEPLNADYLSPHGADDFNPQTDLIMIATNTNSTPVVDLYIRSRAKSKHCFVTHMGGTGQNNTFDTDPGWTINTGQSFVTTEPAAPGGSAKFTGTWVSKVFSKLDVYGDTSFGGKIGIMVESNTPNQPPDGEGYIYSKSDGKLYWRSHDIAEVDLTASSGGGGGGNAFSTVAVSGQNNVVADSSTDTLTFVAGSNVTLTTNDSSDSVTIAAAVAGGKVLQVVHVPFTGAMSSSSTSWVNVTDGNTTMQASITPTASTSKILVQVSANIAVKQNYAAVFQLWNGSTAVDGGVHPAGYNGTDTYNNSSMPRDVGVLFSIFNTTNTYHNKGYAAMLEDAPNTTSQVTYTFRGRAAHASSTFYVNRNTRDQHRLEDSYLGSGITLIEIGA